MRRSIGIIALCSVVLLVACASERSENYVNDGFIHVEVGSYETKAIECSSADASMSRLEIEGEAKDELVLEMIESDYDVNPLEDVHETKGFNVSGDNFNSRYTSFSMDAFVKNGQIVNSDVTMADADNNVYFTDNTVKYSGNEWNLTPAQNWINKVDMIFWSAAPKSFADLGATFASDHQSLSFNYSQPAADRSSDAVNQKDLLFSYYTKKHDGSDNHGAGSDPQDYLSLTFYHALSAVAVAIDKDLLNAGYSITKVYFSGIASKGKCDVTSAPAFNWSNQSTTEVYAQSFTDSDWSTDYTVDSKTYGSDEATEKVFMMIPQTISSDNAYITVDYTKDGKTCSASASIKGHTWSSGKIYRYTLRGLTSDLKVHVQDEVNGPVKSNVKVQNTGDVKSYIRVMLIGNWMTKNGQIYGPWNPSADGKFEGMDTESWKKGADGFYYAVNPYEPGQTLPSLFTSYTVNTTNNTKLSHGLYLNILVAAQSVAWDENKTNATSTWGATAAGYLK